MLEFLLVFHFVNHVRQEERGKHAHMDPLSITASVIAILQIAGTSGQVINKLLALRDAPEQLQQLWNEAESLRGGSWS